MRMKRFVPRVLTVMVVVAALSAVAAEKFTTQLIPREVLFGNPERTNPQISPDGTQLDTSRQSTVCLTCGFALSARMTTGR